eukprot:Partr_v1_DN27874_c3_g1_i2_m22996 putative Responsible for the dehydration of cis-homoaconitate to homoisocitric acid (By similarity)
MIEEGYAFPNTITVASDSHSNMYGGIGCLGTPIVRSDAAALWATGRTWWRIPPVVKVELSGKLGKHQSGKDVIIALCGLFSNDEVLNCAIEFVGNGVSSLSVDDRLSIANMTTEWGALAGLFPVDMVTLAWLRDRARFFAEHKQRTGKFPDESPSQVHQSTHPRINVDTIDNLENDILVADENARYAKTLRLDLSSLADSFVAGPNSVKIASSISSVARQNVSIQKAYLVSCVNSRASDIKSAADVFRQATERSKMVVKVHSGVKFYIAAASSEVQSEAELAGDWQVLIDAGAVPLPPGCGPCIGLGMGLLEENEVGISSTNRNFKGRMGSRSAQCYLGSPRIVAASAIDGRISSPEFIDGHSFDFHPRYSIDSSDEVLLENDMDLT